MKSRFKSYHMRHLQDVVKQEEWAGLKTKLTPTKLEIWYEEPKKNKEYLKKEGK